MNEIPEEKGRIELDSLEKEIQELLLQKAELSREADALILKRKELLTQARGLTQGIRSEREKYRSARDEIKKLRDESGEIITKIRELRKRISERESRVLPMERQVDEDEDNIMKRMKDLEWRLQTEPLTKKKERTMVDEIKRLNEKSLIWKKINEIKKVIDSDSQELNTLESTLNSKNAARNEFSSKFEEGEQVLSVKLDERGEIFQAVEEINAEIGNYGKKITEVQEKLIPLLQRNKEMIRKGREVEEEERARIRKELLKKALEVAGEKERTGKKLTLTELKLLYDQGDYLES